MNVSKNLYLNFSSIPNLTKKARLRKSLKNLSLNKLIKFSLNKKFIGVEFPYFRFFDSPRAVANLIKYLNENNQKYILDCEKKISKVELRKLILISKKLNTNFIRLKCSNILSCERYKYKKNWSIKINSIIKKINQIKPLLKKHKIKLAIENHQDLDSNDLIKIIKSVGKNYVGVNFDIGNAYATCEIPVDFLSKTKKYILNIHLKDYIILPNKIGYELHRCPIMDGNSNIIEILKLVKKFKLNVPISLELGAKKVRKINVKSKNFFKYFITDKKNKLRNVNYIMNVANQNKVKINTLEKLISFNEINMLDRSLKNLKDLKL